MAESLTKGRDAQKRSKFSTGAVLVGGPFALGIEVGLVPGPRGFGDFIGLGP